jgi:hypothetical protein
VRGGVEEGDDESIVELDEVGRIKRLADGVVEF